MGGNANGVWEQMWKRILMTTLGQVRSDAEFIAQVAFFELGGPRLGPRLGRAIEGIQQTLLEYEWRAKTQAGYSSWRDCVHRAAIEIARSGNPPGGARLAKLSEKLFVG